MNNDFTYFVYWIDWARTPTPYSVLDYLKSLGIEPTIMNVKSDDICMKMVCFKVQTKNMYQTSFFFYVMDHLCKSGFLGAFQTFDMVKYTFDSQ